MTAGAELQRQRHLHKILKSTQRRMKNALCIKQIIVPGGSLAAEGGHWKNPAV